jgi:hypothetical protein
MNRETIAAAVYAKLAAMTGVRTSSRRPKTFDQVPPADCPAVFLGVGASESIGNPGPRALWRMEFIVYLYVHDGSAAGPSSQLNAYLGYIDTAFRASAADLASPGASPDHTTLGGLVLYARPLNVQTDEGSFGDQGVAIVTIEVVTAG